MLLLWLAAASASSLDRLEVGGADVTASLAALVVVGAPVGPGFDAPRLTWRCARFPRGLGNILVEGRFGFTAPGARPPPPAPRPCGSTRRR